MILSKLLNIASGKPRLQVKFSWIATQTSYNIRLHGREIFYSRTQSDISQCVLLSQSLLNQELD